MAKVHHLTGRYPRQVVVRAGKGDRDRVTLLPAIADDALRRQLDQVRRLHELDRGEGAGWTELPEAIRRKYPNAPTPPSP